MQAASSRFAAIALATLAIAPLPRARAQNTVTGALHGSGIVSSCPSKFGVPGTPLSLDCSATNGNYVVNAIAQTNDGGPFSTASSTANFSGALPGLSGDDPAHADASATLLQYLTFTGPTDEIFKIVITADAYAIVTNDDPTHIAVQSTATLEAGAIDEFGQLPDSPTQDVFSQSLAGDGTHALSTTVLWDQAVNADCLANNDGDPNICNRLYFSFFTQSQVAASAAGLPALDPGASAFMAMLNPTVTIYVGDANSNHVAEDGLFKIAYTPQGSPPVTATPEPASLTLLATGLASVAGVVRRKRRAALGSN